MNDQAHRNLQNLPKLGLFIPLKTRNREHWLKKS